MDEDEEMRLALELDGEKLRQLTDEDHGPWYIQGASSELDAAACAIWAELCPGLVMGDEDYPRYTAAAKAALEAAKAYRDSGVDYDKPYM